MWHHRLHLNHNAQSRGAEAQLKGNKINGKGILEDSTVTTLILSFLWAHQPLILSWKMLKSPAGILLDTFMHTVGFKTPGVGGLDIVSTEADVSLKPQNIMSVKVSVCFNLPLQCTASSILLFITPSSCRILIIQECLRETLGLLLYAQT